MQAVTSAEEARRLRETQHAFDSVAEDYDGPRGNNASIQEMRERMWQWLDATFAPASHVLDIGCGTGLDAVRMAERGHRVTATDWSPAMVERTRQRASDAHLQDRVRALHIGAHELHRLGEAESLDGAYSNLGPLNCVPDLHVVSRECARLLKPGGALVFTVIGRYCPWEVFHYARRGRWSRIRVRYARTMVPVGMNRHTIWTQYFTPREFYRPFAEEFTLEHHRSVCLCVPPPYIEWMRIRYPGWHRRLWRLDERIGGLPVLRAIGDHFLIKMRKR